MKSITSFRFRAFYSGAIICGLLIACGSIPLRSNDAQDDARRILEKLRVASGATVGEIGGGDGDVAVAVATLLGNEGRVLVTELDPAKIESMQKRFARGNSATVKVTASSADSTKLPDQCCDGIYMRDVYHHFTNPKAMVASLYRNLKPGGRLVVTISARAREATGVHQRECLRIGAAWHPDRPAARGTGSRRIPASRNHRAMAGQSLRGGDGEAALDAP